jgi:hypothetical protein
MINDNDRAYWFGASDSQKVLTPNHATKTWQQWWRVKCGLEEAYIGNMYTAAGSRFEHPILECFDPTINKDRQLIVEELRLRVNYDGDKDGIIYEVKTHKADKPFEITPYVQAQVQTQMYAWQECRDDFKGLYILSYGLTETDYRNGNPTAKDIEFDRIKIHPVKYKYPKKYLKCLKALVEELDEVTRKPSILQDEKVCYFTGSPKNLDCHHIFFGNANRRISDENGFWVWLQHDFHIADSPNNTPHNNVDVDLHLKRECQKKFEETHSREEFMELIGRNYLD